MLLVVPNVNPLDAGWLDKDFVPNVKLNEEAEAAAVVPDAVLGLALGFGDWQARHI